MGTQTVNPSPVAVVVAIIVCKRYGLRVGNLRKVAAKGSYLVSIHADNRLDDHVMDIVDESCYASRPFPCLIFRVE